MGTSSFELKGGTLTIQEIDEDIAALRKEKEKVKRQKEQQEIAELTREVYQSYVDAGFTEGEAWEIFMTLLNKNNK